MNPQTETLQEREHPIVSPAAATGGDQSSEAGYSPPEEEPPINRRDRIKLLIAALEILTINI